MKAKLSPAQVKVLRALAEPGGKAHFLSGLDAYWFLNNREGQVRFLSMEHLIMEGFINLEKDRWGRYKSATITPAGRSYLAEMEGKEDA